MRHRNKLNYQQIYIWQLKLIYYMFISKPFTSALYKSSSGTFKKNSQRSIIVSSGFWRSYTPSPCNVDSTTNVFKGFSKMYTLVIFRNTLE